MTHLRVFILLSASAGSEPVVGLKAKYLQLSIRVRCDGGRGGEREARR